MYELRYKVSDKKEGVDRKTLDACSKWAGVLVHTKKYAVGPNPLPSPEGVQTNSFDFPGVVNSPTGTAVYSVMRELEGILDAVHVSPKPNTWHETHVAKG
jgi:hypothetical protein